MKSYRLLILLFVCVNFYHHSYAQDDKKTLVTESLFSQKKDSLSKKEAAQKKNIVQSNDTTHAVSAIKKDTVARHNPRVATRRSALIPGWGQAYNKEYWKIPIVYGILSIPTVLYFYNNSYYKKTKFAYDAVFAASSADSTLLPNIDRSVKNLDGTPLSLSAYQNYRNSFRQNRDYSILYFLLAWGLQVADATVFAHLKEFDVSSDLSMQINPTFNSQTRTPGLGLVLNLKSLNKKPNNITR